MTRRRSADLAARTCRHVTVLLVVLLAAALPVPTRVVHAAKTPEAVQRPAAAREDLASVRRQIESLQQSLEAAEGSRAEVTDALRESERAISATQRRLHELENERRRVNQQLDQLGQSADTTQAQIDAERDRISALLRQQYLRSEEDNLRLLLKGTDPAELQRNMVAYRRLLAARQREIERLADQLQQLAELRADIDERRLELQGIQREEKAEARKLEQQKADHARRLTRLGKDIDSRRKQIETLRRDETRLTQLIERLAALKPPKPVRPRPPAGTVAPPVTPGTAPAAPITSESLPERNLQGDFAALRGRLRLPVRGDVVNRFGSPRADTGLAWKGLLIRAEAGAPVLAVAPGRVAYADWLRGFGNLLIIDHGDGYMSLYGYNESLLRQAGETVASGDAVAKVGNSGGSDGTGLYFELRRAGTPLDPLAWVGR